ncbi:uncharacterized protein FOMMEDRAFT_128703 [Fomitiporia mediterranea MF3/22]|uniref:uncharacterized protein n=1 Tax=Fomitiporia mediterranea (strain MF3/22) TaxID=694068 RepID=UPI0004409AD9|nr:uncharacterized protein FOMMEDRAFT_128703 [Fomitiporia mediterranea MF3/22]EJC98976.1 hypothetical protein FOMMEDRAFT_128703 [Fomitiporia mediterranea MF3/22]
MPPQRTDLLGAARAFCDAFANKQPIDNILSSFADALDTRCIEYGTDYVAPFLGRPFTGLDGAKEYFTRVNQKLTYKDMHFSDFIVDTDELKVSVKGSATFTSKEYERSWDEVFTYRFEFDEQLKIKSYEVWGDTAGLCFSVWYNEMIADTGMGLLGDY